MIMFLVAALAFVAGFFVGGLMILESVSSECKRGFVKAGKKIYRVEEVR